jgi:hypothetical protein
MAENQTTLDALRQSYILEDPRLGVVDVLVDSSGLSLEQSVQGYRLVERQVALDCREKRYMYPPKLRPELRKVA